MWHLERDVAETYCALHHLRCSYSPPPPPRTAKAYYDVPDGQGVLVNFATFNGGAQDVEVSPGARCVLASATEPSTGQTYEEMVGDGDLAPSLITEPTNVVHADFGGSPAALFPPGTGYYVDMMDGQGWHRATRAS